MFGEHVIRPLYILDDSFIPFGIYPAPSDGAREIDFLVHFSF